MPSTDDLRSAARSARQRIREAEVTCLAERQVEKELRRAYGEIDSAKPGSLPGTYQGGN